MSDFVIQTHNLTRYFGQKAAVQQAWAESKEPGEARPEQDGASPALRPGCPSPR